MSALVRKYLGSSSIHGLVYLADGGTRKAGFLAKVGWFLCVATSFTAAASLIYMNILNWNNSPVIVSDTRPIQLKDGDVTMPMFMVCPRRLSFRNLVENYINANEKSMAADIPLEAVLGRMRAESSIAKRVETQLALARRYGLHDPFRDMCKDEDTRGDPGVAKKCEFYKFLNWLGSVDGGETMQTCLEESIPIYIVGEEGKASTATMERFLQSRCNFAASSDSSPTSVPESAQKAEEILAKFYLPFFPVFTETLAELVDVPWLYWPGYLRDFHLEPAFALDDFNASLEVPESVAGVAGGRLALGTALGYVIDDDVGSAKDLVFDGVFQGLARDLNVSSGPEAVELLSMFAYDGEFFFDDFEPTDVSEPCQPERCGPDSDGDSCAKKYCQAAAKGREAGRKILEIFKMATESAGELDSERSRSLLPSCSWNVELGGNCWESIVTDRGLCYTSYRQGWQLGKQHRMHGTLGFTLEVLSKEQVEGPSATSDVGRRWAAPKEHDISLLFGPAGHFATQGNLLSTESLRLMNVGNKEDTFVKSSADVKFNYLMRTTPEFRAMDPVRRGCLYPDERDLDFFPVYSEANCVLECTWERASAMCGCVPWFLMDHFPTEDVCEVWGNGCFKSVIDGRYGEGEDCPDRCPGDCEAEEIETEVLTVPFPAYLQSFMCTVHEFDMCPLARTRENNTRTVLGKAKSLMYYYGNMREVNVTFPHRTALRMERTAAVTFAGTVSNVGGTLALFCGFSVLSLLEMLYWMVNLVRRMLAKKELVTPLPKRRGIISSYCKETSIHGLSYLVNGEGNKVSLALWAAAITFCFAAAITYSNDNMTQWRESPSAVTFAGMLPIEDASLPQPMVTVCPRNLNLRDLALSYFARHEDEARRLPIVDMVKHATVRRNVFETWEGNVAPLMADGNLNPFKDECFRGSNSSSTKCDFLRHLYAVFHTSTRGGCNGVYERDFVFDYLTESILQRRGLTLAGLREYYRRLTGCLLDVDGVSIRNSHFPALFPLNLYSAFFPLYDSAAGKTAEPRDLTDFDVNLSAAETFDISDTDVGALLGHLLSNPRVLVQEHTNAIVDTVFQGIAKRLGVSDPKVALRMLTYFSYHLHTDFFLRRNPEHPLYEGCEEFKGTLDICRTKNDTGPGLGENCQKYCREMAHAARFEAEITEVFKMAVERANAPWPNATGNMLPACSWREGSSRCWNSSLQIAAEMVSSESSGRVWNFVLEMRHANKRMGPKGFSLDVETEWFDSVAHQGISFVSPAGHFASKTASARAMLLLPFLLGQHLKYTLDVEVVLRTTEEFRAMDPQRRRCYYEDEKPLVTFPVYTKENCELECAWKTALASCHCVPWFLMGQLPSTKLCDLFGNRCFRGFVDAYNDGSRTFDCEGECLDDCETYVVTTTEHRQDTVEILDEDLASCLSNGPEEQGHSLLCDYLLSKLEHTHPLVRKLLHKNDTEIMKSELDAMYLFSLSLPQKTGLTVVLSSTVSTVDMISNVGGIFGLFCGMSLISAVEAAYWAGKGVTGAIKTRMAKNEQPDFKNP